MVIGNTFTPRIGMHLHRYHRLVGCEPSAISDWGQGAIWRSHPVPRACTYIGSQETYSGVCSGSKPFSPAQDVTMCQIAPPPSPHHRHVKDAPLLPSQSRECHDAVLPLFAALLVGVRAPVFPDHITFRYLRIAVVNYDKRCFIKCFLRGRLRDR